MDNEQKERAEQNPDMSAHHVAEVAEAYENRIEKMSNRILRAEVQRQGKLETKKFNYHGIALATVLDTVLEGHAAGHAPYLR
jgi:hypothetical protein